MFSFLKKLFNNEKIVDEKITDMRKCLECSKYFKPNTSRHRYCCKKCADKFNSKKYEARLKLDPVKHRQRLDKQKLYKNK